MSHSDDALSFGLSIADVAWPAVLVLCITIMVLPFLFLVFAVLRPEAEEVGNDPPD
jgi:ABC-type glycerol-3-phosphate transport system permease component